MFSASWHNSFSEVNNWYTKSISWNKNLEEISINTPNSKQVLKLQVWLKGQGIWLFARQHTFFGNLAPAGGRVMCSCTSGSLYIAHLTKKIRRDKSESWSESLQRLTSRYYLKVRYTWKAYMTWLSTISSMPWTGDRKTGGQGSPPHGARYPFIPSLHSSQRTVRI